MSGASYSRRNIQTRYGDLSVWPRVDIGSLSEEDQTKFVKRETAIILMIENPGMTLASISVQTGIPRSEIKRLTDRCLQANSDGRINGFRGLIPHKRTTTYTRTKESDVRNSSPVGHSGEFSRLLQKHPELLQYLHNAVKRYTSKARSVIDRNRNFSSLHKGFIRLCKSLGVSDNEYPFNTDYLGRRSFFDYLKSVEDLYCDRVSEASGRKLSKVWNGMKVPFVEAIAPYDVVEVDGHKIDLMLTVSYVDQTGLEVSFEVGRIWILVVRDVASRAVLGYHLAYSKEYSKQDVLEAIKNAIVPHKRREISIPNLSYADGSGFPSSVIPECAYACWNYIRLDNAKAHLSDDSLRVLRRIVGCWAEFGPPADPNARAGIESFFNMLAKQFAHRLPGTTGSNTQDFIRRLSDVGGDTRLLITTDEFADLVDVWLTGLNASPNSALNGRTPLQQIKSFLRKPNFEISTLPEAYKKSIHMLGEAKVVTVRGKAGSGNRPHVNFGGVRYSSKELSAMPDLTDANVRVYFDSNDIRFLYAYFEDGSELGMLSAARPWNRYPHTLKMRKDINRLKAMGQLIIADEDDPIEAFIKYKKSKASRSMRDSLLLAKASDLISKRPQTAAAVAAESVKSKSKDQLSSTTEGSGIAPVSSSHIKGRDVRTVDRNDEKKPLKTPRMIFK